MTTATATHDASRRDAARRDATPGDAALAAPYDARAPLDADGIDHALVTIVSMGRRELTEHLLGFPASFPVDFTPEFLAAQSVDRLRHLLARLVLHCRIAPQAPRRAA